MKILICLSYYYPNISGLTLYAKILAEELVAKGNEVTIVTSRHRQDLPYKEIINGVTVVRLPTAGILKKVPFMPTLPLQIIPLIRWADVVNCHLPQLESVVIAGLARLLGKPLVATYQTDLVVRSAHYIHRIPLFLADSVIALSEDYAKYSKVLPHFSKKLSYIFPPMHTPRPSNESIEKIKQHIAAHGKYVIGFVGRMAQEKGIEYLLGITGYLEKPILEKIVIALAGPLPIGEKTYKEKMSKLLQQHKDYVVSLGELTKDELDGFYKNLDVLVLPSVNATEALGMVQIEAMLSGVPVVASDLPGVRVPVMATKMGTIVEPSNSQAIARAVTKILENKKKYVKKVKDIEEVFSLKKSITAYEKIFASLARK